MPYYACFTLDQADSCPRRLGLFSRATEQAPLEEISEIHSEAGREKHRKWEILNINGAKRLIRKTELSYSKGEQGRSRLYRNCSI